MTEKLFRSRTDKMIGGVCGGIGDYFSIDPTIIRIIWALFSILGGAGIIVYLICWMIIPKKPLK